MERKFVSAVHDAVMGQQSVSMKQLAAELNKAPSTLYNELNPYPHDGSTAKLGLEDAIRIMDLIGDYTPLNFITHHCGYTLRQSSHDPDGNNFEHECLQGYQAVAQFIQAAQQGEDTSQLRIRCNTAVKELEDVVYRAQEEQRLHAVK
jgi:hypothetical protein